MGIEACIFGNEVIKAATIPVTIITREDVNKKLMQVSRYLLAEDYNPVVVQPDPAAVRRIAHYLASERNERVGETIGYRTEFDRIESSETQFTFCTDNFSIVKELMSDEWRDVLVIDQADRWSEGIEVILAWARLQIAQKDSFKIVLIMGHIEEFERLKLCSFFSQPSDYFILDYCSSNTAGRSVKEVSKTSGTMVDVIARFVKRGRNVLALLPDKEAVEGMCKELKKVPATVLPFYEGLTFSERRGCYEDHHSKVVVSTSAIEWVTPIDDIDVVVDSGRKRCVESPLGETKILEYGPISREERARRKNLAGRRGKGAYVFMGDEAEPSASKITGLRAQTVLQLELAGLDVEWLPFFHEPECWALDTSRGRLLALGCLDKDGKVTKIGEIVSKLPVSLPCARMLVEAERLIVFDDVLTIVSIMEVGGITLPPPSCSHSSQPDWRHLVADEKESDAMGQLAVWKLAGAMSSKQMRNKGIDPQRYLRAKKIRKALLRNIVRNIGGFFRSLGSTGRREDILKSICAGMADRLSSRGRPIGEYNLGEYNLVHNRGLTANGRLRLSSTSLVSDVDWLVGEPFYVRCSRRDDDLGEVRGLMRWVSGIEPMWLNEVAPHFFRVQQKTYLKESSYSQKKAYTETKVYVNGDLVLEEDFPDPNNPKVAELLDNQAWFKWSPPTIFIPDFTDQNVEVPPIRKAIYGTSEVDGYPLVAYSVIYCSEPWPRGEISLAVKWTRDFAEANRLREELIANLPELRKTWEPHDEFVHEIDLINTKREAVLLPIIVRGPEHFYWREQELEYSQESLCLVNAEIVHRGVFDELNVQRKRLNLPVISLDPDGKFFIPEQEEWFFLDEKGLNSIRRTIADRKGVLTSIKEKRLKYVELENKLFELEKLFSG